MITSQLDCVGWVMTVAAQAARHMMGLHHAGFHLGPGKK